MLHNEISRNINFEINQIDKELEAFKPLLDLVRLKTPDLIETTALSSVLHSFYTGIEKIFSIIARGIYKNFPTGNNWHKELLNKMIENENNRAISKDLHAGLLKYLAFRHFFRNAYDFHMDWEEMKSLVLEMTDVWIKVKYEINSFLDR